VAGGEHTWRRVLFDTNLVGRWMDGDTEFQAPLKTLVRSLAKRNATFFVSAVTVQELIVFARLTRADAKAQAFLVQTFTTLPLDERAALEAARIGASSRLSLCEPHRSPRVQVARRYGARAAAPLPGRSS